MKKQLLFIIITTLIFSCVKDEGIGSIETLNGYWTIDSVILADGSKKNYSISTVVDYFEITGDSIGFRKKLSPRLDGTFEMNDDIERFKIKVQSEKLQLRYKTNFAEWNETIIKLQDSILQLQNEAGNVYQYKRFQKFDFGS